MGKTKREPIKAAAKRKSDILEKALSKLSLQQEKIAKHTSEETEKIAVKQAAALDPSEKKKGKKKKLSKFAESIEEVTKKLQLESGKFESDKIDPLAPFEMVPFKKDAPNTKRNKKQQQSKQNVIEAHADSNFQLNPKLFAAMTSKKQQQAEAQQAPQASPAASQFLQKLQQDDEMDDDERATVPDAPGMFYRSACMKKAQAQSGKAALPMQDRTL